MRNFIFLISIVIIFTGNSFSQDEQLVWPREIETKEGLVTIYQPQLESFKNDTLEGRMAISIKPAEGEMLFCAAWFKARLSTDLDARTATLESMEIPSIHFPDIEDDAKIDQLKAFLKKEFESWDVVMSLDRLTASMNEVEDLKNQSVPLKTTIPLIFTSGPLLRH